MKRIALLIAILFFVPHGINGQEEPSAQAPTSLSEARYEIVQMSMAPNWMLKLDRITGNVERLVTEKTGSPEWQKMRVLPHPKAANVMKPHYRITVSNQADQPTLLLDTQTGATWRLVTTGNISLWQPIE